MKKSLLLDISHMLMSQYIKANDIAIDMTAGHGNDTIHLANHAKHVIAFDIQDDAILSTQKKLDEHQLSNVTLIKDSHENFLNYVSSFQYVVFNLGYLPKGDKSITTTSDITLKTLDLALNHLSYDGFIQLMIYMGHPKGMEESISIKSYISQLNTNDYKVLRIDLPYQDNQPPYIILIHKVKKDGN